MRQVKKRWYVVRRERNEDYSVRQEDIEGSFETKKEAISKARRIREYLTDKEKKNNSIHVCKWDSVQDENGDWRSIEEGMSHVGEYIGEFMISCEGHEINTIYELY